LAGRDSAPLCTAPARPPERVPGPPG
jgi:hypothetical protein